MASDPLVELMAEADRHSRLSRARDYVDRAIELAVEADVDTGGRVLYELGHARDDLDAQAAEVENGYARLIAGGPS